MGVIEGLRAPKMFAERLRPPEPRSERCLSRRRAVATEVGTMVGIWIVAYSLMSARHVYGGSWPGTIGRAAGIGVLDGAAALLGLIGAVHWAALLA